MGPYGSLAMKHYPMLSFWRNDISKDYKDLPKKWQKVMQQLDEEHPEIRPNRFKHIYTGTNTWWYDLNNEDNPIDQIEAQLDGEDLIDSEREELEDRARELRIQIGKKMLKCLKGVRKKIIKKKYFEEKSLAQIGRELKMSRQLVYYHHCKALEYLRQSIYAKRLED